MTRRAERGFTLVEVLVALAVAGGALVLILSATTASLTRSAHARASLLLERASESKLSEWLSGTERDGGGGLPGFDGYRWEVRHAPALIGDLEDLRRITFKLEAPDGSLVLEWTVLRYVLEKRR